MTGASVSQVADTKATTAFGWQTLYYNKNYRSDHAWIPAIPDEQMVVTSIERDGSRAIVTAGRKNSHDLEVTLGIDTAPPGFYEVKRLSSRPGGKSFDPRFKAGRRGETIYGRRDAEIKTFVMQLENFLDQCEWGVEAVTSTHDFIDQALQRRHGKKFNERLLRLAHRGLSIGDLLFASKRVIQGGVGHTDISAGFAGLAGIFIIAGHNYTLVRPNEYKQFIGFDSASAEGPRLRYSGVIQL